MAFFEAEIEQNKDLVLLGWASRLHSILVQARRCSPSKVLAWADDFRKLRKHETDADIELLLTWFEQHAVDKYTPRVFSAKSFLAKFRQLWEAMAREQEGRISKQASDDAWKISRDAGGLLWPGKEKDQELTAIDNLLEEYRVFVRKIQDLENLRGENHGLCRHIMQTMPYSRGLVLNRLLEAHRAAWEWDGWTGDLIRFMRLRHGTWFRKMILGWVREYRGAGDWSLLVEELLGQGD
jgi:hypothetical protein